MPAYLGQANKSAARGRAAKRLRMGDDTTYTVPDQDQGHRRQDARLVWIPQCNELDALIEEQYQGRRVRVKNSSGGSFAAGTLLAPATASALEAVASGTASSSPQAGTGVAITVTASTGTFVVGQLVVITTAANLIEIALITARTSTTIMVDILNYNHVNPTIEIDPAYVAVKANATGGILADWVLVDAIANGAYGWAYAAVEVGSLDTSALTRGAALYLDTTAGGITATAPSGLACVQTVGIVKVVDAAVGIIKMFPGLHRVLAAAGGMPAPVTAGYLLVDQGAGVSPIWKVLSGDATILSTGALTIANSAITNAKVSASAAIAYSKLALTGAILNADLAGSIAYSKLALTGAILNADINASAAIAYSKLALTGAILNADINASAAIAYSKLNLATSIVNADIASAAAIAFTKLAALTSGNILVGNGSNVAVSVAMSGDVTLTNAGVAAIGAAKVTNAMLAGSIDLTAKVTGALPVLNGGSGQSSFTNGQLLIGNTSGNTLAKATLTAGAGIAITNGAGAITIAQKAAGQIRIGARDMWTSTTAGATGPTLVETGTNKVNYYGMAFPQASTKYAEFGLVMPPDYNGGTVTMNVMWLANSASSNTVAWYLEGQWYGDSEPIDAAYGTPAGITEAYTGIANTVKLGSTSAVCTIAGSVILGTRYLQFRISRNGGTLAAVAILLGVSINYTKA